MLIIKNPKWTKEQHEKFSSRILENEGYCLCKLCKVPENKCMCQEFLESTELGECHCGKYIKKEL